MIINIPIHSINTTNKIILPVNRWCSWNWKFYRHSLFLWDVMSWQKELLLFCEVEKRDWWLGFWLRHELREFCEIGWVDFEGIYSRRRSNVAVNLTFLGFWGRTEFFWAKLASKCQMTDLICGIFDCSE